MTNFIAITNSSNCEKCPIDGELMEGQDGLYLSCDYTLMKMRQQKLSQKVRPNYLLAISILEKETSIQLLSPTAKYIYYVLYVMFILYF